MEVHPTGGTFADIYRAENQDPSTALGFSLGTTSDPENFVLPSFSLHAVVERNVRRNYYAALKMPLPPAPAPVWNASYLVIRDATEGTNHSIYVREGIYETNYTLELDEVDRDDPQWRQKIAGSLKERRADAVSRQFGYPPQPRVYIWVPALMAARSCAAEQEHLDDLRRAYAMTLGTLTSALEGARGRAASEPLAQNAATATFTAALPVAVRGLGTNTASWSAKYLALCAKSAGRDHGDHSFSLELVDDAAVPNLGVTYLAGGQREENGRLYAKVITGTTRIPGARTQDLIVY